MAWDKTFPAGTEDLRQGDDHIRAMNLELETALTAYGYFPITSATPKFHYYGQRGDTASRPTNGEGGLYADTDVDELLRDSGAAWHRVAVTFAAGTKAVFYQAAAPNGWTIDAAKDGRLLYIDSGNGGTTTGSWDGTTSSNGAHTHEVGKYYSTSLHGFIMYLSNYGDVANRGVVYYQSTGQGSGGLKYVGEYRISGSILQNEDFHSSSEGAHTHTENHVAANHEVINCILCTKD
jgi:hypothetical protein